MADGASVACLAFALGFPETSVTWPRRESLRSVVLCRFLRCFAIRKQHHTEKKSNEDPARKGNHEENKTHLQSRVLKCNKCIDARTNEDNGNRECVEDHTARS